MRALSASKPHIAGLCREKRVKNWGSNPPGAPRISRFSGLFFVYRKILKASARFPLHVHALEQGFGSDSATPQGHPTANPALEVNADQNQLLH